MTYPIFKSALGKKRIRTFIVFSAVIVIMAVISFLLPATGRVTPRMAKEIRCGLLTEWYKNVNTYISEKNQIPSSLFEVCQAAHRKGQWPFPSQGILANDEFPNEYTLELLKDPNQFNKEVPYEFFVDSNSWFIKEQRPGKVYKNMLMIDQNGKIFEIQKTLKQE
jgi:hypothetical protein